MALLTVVAGSIPASADINVVTAKRAVVWVDAVWQATVSVPYDDNTAKDYSSSYVTTCSGWIVSGEGHVVTAGHCVRPTADTRLGLLFNLIKQEELVGANNTQLDPRELEWQVNINPSPTIKIGQPSSVSDRVFTTNLTAQLIDSQDPDAGDNALVQVANFDTSAAVLPVAAKAPEVLDQITSVGFPGDTARITEVDRQDPTFKQGLISSKVTSKTGVPQLQLDGELIGGMSGGPALNASGEVVGVNSSSFTGFNQSYVTDTSALRTFLTRNAVPLSGGTTTAPDPDATGVAVPAPQTAVTASESSGVPLWVLGPLGLLVVALIVAIALLVKARKSAAAQPDNESAPNSTNSWQNDPPAPPRP